MSLTYTRKPVYSSLFSLRNPLRTGPTDVKTNCLEFVWDSVFSSVLGQAHLVLIAMFPRTNNTKELPTA